MPLKTEDNPLTIWTIYRGPNDHGDRWVLRTHEVLPGRWVYPNEFCYVAATLDEARAKVPPGTRRMSRETDDHPTIHESWVAEVAGPARH